MLGIPNDRIEVIHEPTRFSEIIVPEQSMYPGEWWTDEYKSIFDRIALLVERKEIRLETAYLSRTMFEAASAREIGER